MALVTIPFTYTVGGVIISSQLNSCNSIIYSDFNGNIQDVNIASNAAIADTKLAAISTAGKVSGAALTTLTSIPSGAGLIPVANIDVGTSASKIVQLTAAAKLPAVDASLVTGITSTGITAILGSWASKSANTVYQATTDGIIVAMGRAATNSPAAFNILTDSSNPPTTMRAQLYTTSGTTDLNGTLTVPVRKNDYYKIVATGDQSEITQTNYFIPIGT